MAADKTKLSTTGKKVVQLINQTVTGIYQDAVNRKNETWFPGQKDPTKPVDSTILYQTLDTEAKKIVNQTRSALSEEDRAYIDQYATDLPIQVADNYKKIIDNNGYRFGFTADYQYDSDPYGQRIGTSYVGNMAVPTYAMFLDNRRTNKNVSAWAATNNTYSMCDIVCTIEIETVNGEHVYTNLGKLQTLSYSIYQQKQPVRVLGNMNAKDYVYGQRTIAGSLVFAVFNRHWLVDIYDQLVNKSMMKNWHYVADELPPFNITVSFANEYGFDSKMALYGVRLMTEGQVMSINDIYIENTYQFVATDIEYMDALSTWQSTDKIGRRWDNTKGTITAVSSPSSGNNPTMTGKLLNNAAEENTGSATEGNILIGLEDGLNELTQAEAYAKLQSAYHAEKLALQEEMEKVAEDKEKAKDYQAAIEQLEAQYKAQRQAIGNYYAKQKVDKAKTS